MSDLLGGAAASWGVGRGRFQPPAAEGFAQQQLDLGVCRAQFAGCQPLDHGVERRIETEEKGFARVGRC
jgi:hypothetical protein